MREVGRQMALKYYFSTCAQSVIIYCVLFHVLRANLAATKAKIETNDFSNMTKDDILGDLLFTTALSYFAELDAMNYMQAKTMGVNIIRLPSESIFSFELDVATSFYDVPISVSGGGLAMDVDHNVHVVKALNGDNDKKKEFMLASGMTSSALEHSVPEQLFSLPENPAQGVSAVKALQIANDQGIPIYKINQSNVNTIIPQLQIDADAKSDIRNSVNAGKEVTVSKTDITYNGWTGCGYIVIDPKTGAGAYMISGGLAGSMIFGIFILSMAGLFLLLSLILSGSLFLVAIALLLLISIFLAVASMSIPFLYGDEKGTEFFKCFYGMDIAIEASFKLISILLEETSSILLESFLTAINVIKFGECLRTIIEK